MRKIYLLTTMALIMIGCSSNDEDNQQVDALLAGTEWTRTSQTLLVITNRDIDTHSDFDIKFLNDILTSYFPGVQLIYTEEISLIEKNDTTEHYVPEPYGKLTFSQKECQYYGDSGYTMFTYWTDKYYTRITTYAEQSYTSTIDPYMSLEVTKDAIIISTTNPYDYQQQSTYLPLNDFQCTETWGETIITGRESVRNDIEEETFSYQRNDNEVILTNSNKKWVGTLDTDDWTLSVVQIVPEEKKIGTFYLR